jgi:uncharacterized protein (DUF1697 family)
MTKFIALLRGVNVGGNNKIPIPELKAAFETAGFENVLTYINSSNVIFDSALGETAIKAACERAIADAFGLHVPVGIITADELRDALANAPDWWNMDKDSKHNAIFVIAPATAKSVRVEVGEAKPEYESVAYHDKIIFWTAPLATFSRTRWSKLTQHKAAYSATTICNANTALKLLKLTGVHCERK